MNSRGLSLPYLNFRHLKTLTDDTGILQHAKFRVPNRLHGYCVDDNTRALRVATLGRDYCAPLDALATVYLGFLYHSYNHKLKRFRNFLSYDRQWLDSIGSEDCHGRAVWCLGNRAATEAESSESVAAELFSESLYSLRHFDSLRGCAFAILGMEDYQAGNRKSIDCAPTFEYLADKLKKRTRERVDPNWPWPEDCLTYDNARIPHALIVAGNRLDDTELKNFGLNALHWLMDIQTCKRTNCFSPVGNEGWYCRGGVRARFDQQPLEAAAMVDACLAAFHLTRDSRWYDYAVTSLQWFLGFNTLGYSVYDPSTGGCSDAIMRDGMNRNEGAESTLSCLLALLAFYRLPEPSDPVPE